MKRMRSAVKLAAAAFLALLLLALPVWAGNNPYPKTGNESDRELLSKHEKTINNIYDGSPTTANLNTTGTVTAGTGVFSAVTVTTINKTGTGVVTNLNADMVDGYHFREYISSEQTITSGAAVTPMAHGLGTDNVLIQAWLVCKTAEYNYAVGNKVVYMDSTSDSVSDNHGHSIIVDATNIYVRFGANANVYTAINASSGAGVALTNSNWKLVIRAFAL